MPELSNGVPAAAAPAPPRERRAAVRLSCALDTAYHPVPEGERLCTGLVRDISTTGLGLLVDRYVEPETVLDVAVESEDGDLAYTLLVQVRHARDQGNGRWLLGCAFARSLSRYELELLL
jgi:c-di-GMP-binding flagellar brake protein YcgR